MAAEPKKRISKVRGKTRRAHQHAVLPKLVNCAKCKAPKLPHTLCSECGHYGKIKISETKLDKKITKVLDKPAFKDSDKPAPSTDSGKPASKDSDKKPTSKSEPKGSQTEKKIDNKEEPDNN